MKKILAVALLAALSGCHYRHVKDGSAAYTSISVGTNQAVAPFSIKAGQKDTPGFRDISSGGVTTDQTSAIETVVGAAIAAGIKAGTAR